LRRSGAEIVLVYPRDQLCRTSLLYHQLAAQLAEPDAQARCAAG
jgi:hypothetical protein